MQEGHNGRGVWVWSGPPRKGGRGDEIRDRDQLSRDDQLNSIVAYEVSSKNSMGWYALDLLGSTGPVVGFVKVRIVLYGGQNAWKGLIRTDGAGYSGAARLGVVCSFVWRLERIYV